MDSLSPSCDSAEPQPLNTREPSFDVSLPEDSKPRVNKGFRVSEIWGRAESCSYRSSVLEFFTNAAK